MLEVTAENLGLIDFVVLLLSSHQPHGRDIHDYAIAAVNINDSKIHKDPRHVARRQQVRNGNSRVASESMANPNYCASGASSMQSPRRANTRFPSL